MYVQEINVYNSINKQQIVHYAIKAKLEIINNMSTRIGTNFLVHIMKIEDMNNHVYEYLKGRLGGTERIGK